MENVQQPRIGTKRYFVGLTQIAKPQNHNWPPKIYKTLLEQSGIILKEFNGKEWVVLPTS